MKSDGEIMEILAAFDLTGSFKAAAELCGCSHHTVAAHVAARDAGRPLGELNRRPQVTDSFLFKIEEWVESSHGKIRADVVHQKLILLGYAGSERSTRRAVAEVKRAVRLGHARVHRPWITEPGLWLQYDFGDGPLVGTGADAVKAVLFVAWLAWSRFRVVIALRDKTQPSVIAALDRTFRLLEGVPTYLLTDNEKTVTVEHIAGVPVRNAQAVSFGRHYGVTVLTCEPADPASKGGVEAAVKISKADLVPTETNLRDGYASFAELEAACADFMTVVNGRTHRVTRRPPVEMLAEERLRLHRVPDQPHTVVFGLARRVPINTPMITFEHGQYSVPQSLLGEQVWVRATGIGAGEQIVILHHARSGPVEVARHARATPGSPRIDDDHFGGPPTKQPGQYTIRPRTEAEAAFLAIGDGAHVWLAEAAAAGVQRIRAKMEAAVTMAKVAGNARVDWALGHAAVNGRFGWKDLASILNAQLSADTSRRATETRSLSQGTAGWAQIGRRPEADTSEETTR
ncbi:MAG TPA: IS21 family transposase [Nocardioides sp.]|nr:IS21 family transposase [Nocardioides sp.]